MFWSKPVSLFPPEQSQSPAPRQRINLTVSGVSAKFMLHVQISYNGSRITLSFIKTQIMRGRDLLSPKHGQNTSSSLMTNKPSNVMQRLYPEDQHKELWLGIVLYKIPIKFQPNQYVKSQWNSHLWHIGVRRIKDVDILYTVDVFLTALLIVVFWTHISKKLRNLIVDHVFILMFFYKKGPHRVPSWLVYL